jgi:hypothetical protein
MSKFPDSPVMISTAVPRHERFMVEHRQLHAIPSTSQSVPDPPDARSNTNVITFLKMLELLANQRVEPLWS